MNGTSSVSRPATTPPPKRSRPSRPRSTPIKNNVIAVSTPPCRLIPSSSIEDDTSSMESNSTSNSIHSTMADLLDRCSSPPSASTIFDNDIRSCLNELCNRITLTIDEPSSAASIIYNPIPSPVFKRKIEEQASSNKRTTKVINHTDEQTPKKKRSRPSTKKSSNDITNITMSINKKEEPVEQEICDAKPTLSTPSIMTPPVSTNATDYICEWDSCRR